MKRGGHIKFRFARIINLLPVFIILSVLHLAFLQSSSDTEPDYKDIFGHDYEFALEVIERETWMTDSLAKNGFDPDFALAIIFPELIRYSSIIDFIQVRALEVLYVQYGNDYADFSIGYFQVKPSFAQQIESDMLKYNLDGRFPSLSALKPGLPETMESRRERIIRIKDEHFQLLYLQAFVRIMDTLYPDLADAPPGEKLIFYSTAYNTGYFKDEREIRDEMTMKRFYRGMDPASKKYFYSAIALSYYVSRKGYE